MLYILILYRYYIYCVRNTLAATTVIFHLAVKSIDSVKAIYIQLLAISQSDGRIN
jgi:hypothetical protein